MSGDVQCSFSCWGGLLRKNSNGYSTIVSQPMSSLSPLPVSGLQVVTASIPFRNECCDPRSRVNRESQCNHQEPTLMPSFWELVPVAGQQGRPMMPFGWMENSISIDRDRNGDRPGIFPWKGVPWKSFVVIARQGQPRTGQPGKRLGRMETSPSLPSMESSVSTRCRPSSRNSSGVIH